MAIKHTRQARVAPENDKKGRGAGDTYCTPETKLPARKLGKKNESGLRKKKLMRGENMGGNRIWKFNKQGNNPTNS